jgi:hypothetical protein
MMFRLPVIELSLRFGESSVYWSMFVTQWSFPIRTESGSAAAGVRFAV